MAHNKTLNELKWFKRALWGPISTAVFIVVIIAIWDNSQQTLSWGLSSAHINDAISRLKLPLAIASLAFPLVALVASHHRSVQTAAQIARTDQQMSKTDRQITASDAKNAFENRLKHFELFKNYIEDVAAKKGIKIEDFSLLYRDVFHKNDFELFYPFVVDDYDHYKLLADNYGKEVLNFFDFFNAGLGVVLTNVKEGYKYNSGDEVERLLSMLHVSSYMNVDVKSNDFSKIFCDCYSHGIIYESLAELYLLMASFSVKDFRSFRGEVFRVSKEHFWVPEKMILGVDIDRSMPLEDIEAQVNEILKGHREEFNKRLELYKTKSDARVE